MNVFFLALPGADLVFELIFADRGDNARALSIRLVDGRVCGLTILDISSLLSNSLISTE